MKNNKESGIALIAVLLTLVLMGALLETFIITINSRQKSLSTDIQEDRTLAGALGVLERITSQMASALGKGNITDADLEAIADNVVTVSNKISDGTGNQQELVDDAGNKITVSATVTRNNTETRLLGADAKQLQGLQGELTSYTVAVTAHSETGEEVRLERDVQVIHVPVFQFGMFSDSDLAFFAGAAFNFGGRAHTNGDLYLSNYLQMDDRATAVKNVKTMTKPNGSPSEWKNNGVNIIRIKNGNGITYRNLKQEEGLDNSFMTDTLWKNCISSAGCNSYPGKGSVYQDGFNGYLQARPDNVHALKLPIIPYNGVEASCPEGQKCEDAYNNGSIDIIRRPEKNEDHLRPDLLAERFYSKASLRIMLSDNVDDFDMPGITSVDPVPLFGTYNNGGTSYSFAAAPANVANTNYKVAANAPLIGGYIKIELQDASGDWTDVTREIMNKGVTGKAMINSTSDPCTGTFDTDSIIRVQRHKNESAVTCSDSSATNMWPNVLFDTREAIGTEDSTKNPYAGDSLFLGGVMHYVELDIAQLNTWLKGKSSVFRADTGYIVYFSDRRSSRRVNGIVTARYQYENSCKDPASTNDIKYSDIPTNDAKCVIVDADGSGIGERLSGEHHLAIYDTANNMATPLDTITSGQAMVNPPAFFRRALKLVNGSAIDLGINSATRVPWGLTIASENPVYIQGNYNSDATRFNNAFENSSGVAPVVPASVIADAVSLLSNDWNDYRSFSKPYASIGRVAKDTYYRLAIIGGKNKSFTPSTSAGDYGTDGGAHNFMRLLESWDGKSLYYKGSLVSLFYSQQAVGVFKYTDRHNIYRAPTRNFYFDTQFENVDKLPPSTPKMRDINVLSFTRVIGDDNSTGSGSYKNATSSYRLTYDTQGVAGCPPAQTTSSGVATVAYAPPAPAGQFFIGWGLTPNLPADSGSLYQPGTRITIHADTTLYAIWSNSIQ